jgi:rRNA-processing protein FCF1
MKELNDLLRKRFSEKHQGKNMIGSIILNELYSFYHLEKSEDIVREHEMLEGYLKHDKYFIRTSDLGLKIKIYKDKVQLLKLINEKLHDLGYTREIHDLYFKS